MIRERIVISDKMLKTMVNITKTIERGGDLSVLDKDRAELEALEEKERYFYNMLVCGTEFENNEKYLAFEKCLPHIALRYKRLLVMILTFKEFLKTNSIVGKYTLNEYALTKIVKCYMDDLKIIKQRQNCETAQLPKIAGLMANLIAKYRPIIPTNHKDNLCQNINEAFAVYHALCICADFSHGDELMEFAKTDEHRVFYADMIYLLNRNFTPENLIVTFKTLSLFQFKSFLCREVLG